MAIYSGEWVRKRSGFGSPGSVALNMAEKCPDTSVKISVFVATNTVGKCPDGLKMTSSFMLTNVETWSPTVVPCKKKIYISIVSTLTNVKIILNSAPSSKISSGFILTNVEVGLEQWPSIKTYPVVSCSR